MTALLIGIDAGTSVIKSIAFDFSGRQVAACSIANSYTTNGAAAEQNQTRTWLDTASTLRGLAEKLPDLPARVAAIAVTGQGDGTWLIDKTGEPVAPAWLWLDARAASIVDELRARPEDRDRFLTTGTGLAACQQGPQLLWMKQHMPEAVGRAAHAMHCKDWLYFNLTGDTATDPSEGNFSFGDFRTRSYNDDVIETLGLSSERRLMPRMVDGTQESAPLSKGAADATGLLAGTPVVLGYVDVICTALGAGLYDSKEAPGVTIVGSTGMHMRLVLDAEDVALNDENTGYTMTMPVPGVCAQMQSNMASTLNIDWLISVARGLLADEGVERSTGDLLARLDNWVENAEPASLLYQPYISEAGERGPFIDANARAGFVGLNPGHGFNDMMRAVFEGLALAARDCYSATGSIPGQVRLTGGAARSRNLRRIIAAAIGADVRTSSREEAGAAGAAMIAAVQIGQYDTMQDCVDEWVTPMLGDLESPEPELSAIYEQTYPSYVAAHQALRPIWSKMATTRENAS